jgi:Flp pilus assembly protein TadG
MSLRIGKCARRCRGTTLVEAAIVLPLLLLVIFGLMEYGSMFLRLQQIENVSRQAARMAATPDATQTQVEALATQMMADVGLGSSGYITTITPTDPATAARGDHISVNIQVTYANIAITNAPLIPVPTTLSRTVVMAKESP